MVCTARCIYCIVRNKSCMSFWNHAAIHWWQIRLQERTTTIISIGKQVKLVDISQCDYENTRPQQCLQNCRHCNTHGVRVGDALILIQSKGAATIYAPSWEEALISTIQLGSDRHAGDSQLPFAANFQDPLKSRLDHLVKWVGSCAPVGEEHAEANSLEDTADNSDGNSVEWALLGHDLCDDLRLWLAKVVSGIDCCSAYAWSSAGHEDQASKISGTFIAQSPSGIDESSNGVSLNGGPC